ncbi:bacteriocin immunity protein [Photobacterium halotolerans]|uniref:Bacteriocin immunity protein n=1 Tax=Photobacterium halotolerans TaxID=265726 RepID=A0A7X5B090_9GAMM|nr:bacteriocin immunity protein [Photobacterium halotolerans]NAW65457.1 bacteriocin immunity protein [Photobacterium halotolerans]NAW87018.1 bacteriocin immunity protein [Photobacterium halotolerans]
MYQLKKALHNYTENEFLEIISVLYAGELEDDAVDELADFFDEKVKHPEHRDLVFYTKECGIEETPEAIISELKRWYTEQGLPCFKPE